MFDLTGKSPLFTGAPVGIGDEIAKTLHAQAAHVVLMAEGHDLGDGVALIGEVRRADDAADHPEDEPGDEDRPEDRDARERIGTAVENLRH